MEINLDKLVEIAKNGDKQALEDIVLVIQDRLYGLAMRMLGHPQDAQDATQEILIKIITSLSSFRGESSFITWTYQIAANHLRTTRKRRQELNQITFEQLAEFIDLGLSITEHYQDNKLPDINLLAKEIEISCTQAMLLCLDREDRLTLLLADFLELDSIGAAKILDITPSAFRQRLSRARKTLQSFLEKKCGLINQQNPCRCEKQINACLLIGKLKPEKLLFAEHPIRLESNKYREAIKARQDLKSFHKTIAVFRRHPDYASPQAFTDLVKQLINSGNYNF